MSPTAWLLCCPMLQGTLRTKDSVLAARGARRIPYTFVPFTICREGTRAQQDSGTEPHPQKKWALQGARPWKGLLPTPEPNSIVVSAEEGPRMGRAGG